MLILNLHRESELVVSGPAVIRVLKRGANKTTVGITAPAETRVLRSETGDGQRLRDEIKRNSGERNTDVSAA